MELLTSSELMVLAVAWSRPASPCGAGPGTNRADQQKNVDDYIWSHLERDGVVRRATISLTGRALHSRIPRSTWRLSYLELCGGARCK